MRTRGVIPVAARQQCRGQRDWAPYGYWRKTHAIHHATSGNLDTRGFGDIDTLTVREYLSRPWIKRVLYRLYRHPAVLLLIGPTYQFVIKHRFPLDTPRAWKREWASVHWTNAGLVAVLAVMWFTIGLDRFLLVQLPITLIAGSMGVFLFYVQHQYEDTYWRYRETWDYYAAGLEGASHFRLPAVLQWFTANIGLHHIHHLCSRIPNYHLQQCYDENCGSRCGMRRDAVSCGFAISEPPAAGSRKSSVRVARSPHRSPRPSPRRGGSPPGAGYLTWW